MPATLIERAKKELGAEPVLITVEQFHHMMEMGILREGDPIELVDGLPVLIDRSDRGDPRMHGPRHASTLTQLDDVLGGLLPAGYFKRMQLPVSSGTLQEPQPDAAIVKGRSTEFRNRHPGRDDVAAVFEVSDSSLNYDRSTKQSIYASAGFMHYIIVNLVDELVELYRDPLIAERCYRLKTTLLRGEALMVDLGAGVTLSIPVADILPPARTISE